MKKGIVAKTRDGLARLFQRAAPLRHVDDSRGWRMVWSSGIRETDFQQDVEVNHNAVLANWALFSCMTLIASDIAKVCWKLVEKNGDIWVPTDSSAFGPVLRQPNHFQTRQQFIESWVLSKLSNGNFYALKERDNRGVVVREYPLDPCRVEPLVSMAGDVFYRLNADLLAHVPEEDLQDFVAVPASEIIHDRFNCLFHPLVGLSPIFASGLAALQGQNIQRNSTKFFGNMSRPSGILTAPGAISNETAQRLKDNWEANYGGNKIGKVAVLGDDLKYQQLGVTASDSQMVEQMKLTAEMICSTFHVPSFKIGAGTIPSGQKVEDLNQIYYADCLHSLMDAIETLQGLALGLDSPKEGRQLAVRFDLDDLLKMDSRTLAEVEGIKVQRGIASPDEARRKFNLGPVTGGKQPYLQQQNYSLEALAKRDAQEDPFSTGSTPPAANDDEPMSDEDMDAEMEEAA